MGSRMSTILRKDTMVIIFAQSRVSISFSCIVSKIQNSGHSHPTCCTSTVSRKNATIISFT
ncbi:hypothetical protein B296_00008359 [Ensete ventricosum]|uniref:Uncharacterized protein n=1 Tax=Ensete ventricosum TaxID=4639 RepID=A0A426ZRU6_ENSVE|nr:hypothetical protein B296_00008359 [Ensete ventricosum]